MNSLSTAPNWPAHWRMRVKRRAFTIAALVLAACGGVTDTTPQAPSKAEVITPPLANPNNPPRAFAIGKVMERCQPQVPATAAVARWFVDPLPFAKAYVASNPPREKRKGPDYVAILGEAPAARLKPLQDRHTAMIMEAAERWGWK